VKPPAAEIMTVSAIKRFSNLVFGVFVLIALVTPAMADQVSREQEITELRLGQRILVDDGSCPAGQIKQVYGARMTASGILRARQCVPRLGKR
jgi:hypothetical protein